jgi:hypothetical protein
MAPAGHVDLSLQERTMSLNASRSFSLSLLMAAAVALMAAACGGSQPMSPTAPSLVNGAANAIAPDGEWIGDLPEDIGQSSEPEPPPAAPVPETEADEGGPKAEPAPVPAPVAGPTPAPAPDAVPAADVNPGPFPALPSRSPVFWTPTRDARVLMRVNPTPVPFSGVPVPLFSCRDLAHTWYYDQIIHAESHISFRITERENYFDGRLVSRTPENIEVAGNGTAMISSRWCSAFGSAHTAQHRFKAKDRDGNDFVINGPLIELQKNPHYAAPPTPGTFQTFDGGSAAVLVAGH